MKRLPSALHASLTRFLLEPSVSIRKKYPLEPRVSKWLQPRTNLLNTVPSIFLLWRHTTITSEQKKNQDPFQLSTQSCFGHKTNVYNSCVSLDNFKERGGGGGRQVNNKFMRQRAYVEILITRELWRARKRRKSCSRGSREYL